jgi:hypothetical protein
LPIIQKKKIKVIIITSQLHLPQIHRSYKTDKVLHSPNILLWISQNPIYTENKKYMAFPYGMYHHKVNEYVEFIKSNDINTAKTIKIVNQYATPHKHLPSDHIRKRFDIFGTKSGEPTNYTDFLQNIVRAEFVISTAGDRDDSYRHYECIGLDAIPVSNIGGGYTDIFGNNMIYSNAEDMIQMIQKNQVEYTYTKPNKDILTIEYWSQKIQERIRVLKDLDGTEHAT